LSKTYLFRIITSSIIYMLSLRIQFDSQAQMKYELRPKKPNTINLRELVGKLGFNESDNK